MNIQAPPNLAAGALPRSIAAGINDWGGVSPVTPDHVNPEAPWPQLDALARETAAAGKVLVERLAIYPAYVAQRRALARRRRCARAVLRAADAEGFARADAWIAGRDARRRRRCRRCARRRGSARRRSSIARARRATR